MKLGIGSYTYMWSIGFPGAAPERPLTARGLVEKACELGVKVVQFGPNLSFDGEDCRYAQRAGLELEIGVLGLDLAETIPYARSCGAALLRTVLQEEAAEIPPQEWIEQKLCDLIPILEQHGVRLALENSVVRARQVRQILEGLAHPALGVTLDTANSLAISEGWRHVLAELAPFTFCLHLKDFQVRREWHRMGFRVEGRPAGQGQLDVQEILGALHHAGARCNVILELWPPQQESLAATVELEDRWARESVAYLRQFIKE